MSHTPQDPSRDSRALDEYLQGASPVSERYREMAAEEVPPQLDARVLAAAKESLQRQHARRWMRWTAPAAAAASVLIVLSIIVTPGVREQASVTLDAPPSTPTLEHAPSATPQQSAKREEVQRTQTQAGDERSQERDAGASAPDAATEQRVMAPPPAPPAAQPRAEAARPRAPAETERSRVEAARRGAPAETESRRAAEPSQELSEVTVTSASSSPAASQRDVEPQVRREAPAAASAAAPAKQSTGADAMDLEEAAVTSSVDAAQVEPPGPWLERIRALRKGGEFDAAEQELQRFRAAYPDYPIEPALTDE